MQSRFVIALYSIIYTIDFDGFIRYYMRKAYLFLWYLGIQLAILGLTMVFIDYQSIKIWFANLNKPGFTPSDSVFRYTWYILYVFIGLAGWLIAIQKNSEERVKALVLWYLQTFFNFFWAYFFFYRHFMGWAIADILILDIVVCALVLYSWRVSFVSFLLLIPYFGWLAFATIVNFSVFFMN